MDATQENLFGPGEGVVANAAPPVSVGRRKPVRTQLGDVLEVLNLGGGVQSTTLALMAVHGDLPPLDYAIFSDTGRERQATYVHVALLAHFLARHGIKVIFAKAHGNGIVADHHAFLNGTKKRVETMPFRIVAEDGTPGAPIIRKCTRHYKHRPVDKVITRLKREHPDRPIRRWLGISSDEKERMMEGFWHPLIEERVMGRTECLAWLSAHGYSAPRSACIECPYHDNAEWRDLRDNSPEEFAQAVAFDESLRASRVQRFDGLNQPVYLHKSCVPLAQADLEESDDGQRYIECSGGCFV